MSLTRSVRIYTIINRGRILKDINSIILTLQFRQVLYKTESVSTKYTQSPNFPLRQRLAVFLHLDSPSPRVATLTYIPGINTALIAELRDQD
jgi:hypothetical protein